MSPEERVAQAIRVALYDPQLSRNIVSGDSAKRAAAMDAVSRAALSALPSRELLAEALDALTECTEALFWCYDVAEWPASGESTQDKALARARAAADKIRAALTQEKQP